MVFNVVTQQTLELVDRISTQMDNSKIPINIFLDLSKAFDAIDHKILLDKLKYYVYGLEGPYIETIQQLQNKYKAIQCNVELGDIKSKTLKINTGVPQGSILEPLVFIIYINDISQSSEMFNLTTYADDTTISSTLNNKKYKEH